MGSKKTDNTADSIDALAAALSPIAAAMIHGELSAAVLVRAAKLAYVRAAIAETCPSGSRINVSSLSVVTGLTRKEISSLLNDALKRPGPIRGRPMEQRALRVLHGWMTDPLFKNAFGRPIDLSIDGDGRNFASLVRAYGGDVTTIAVLRELERLNAIVRTPGGKLRPKPRATQLGLKSAVRFKDFSQLLAGFSNTVSQLLVKRDPPLYFGFKELGSVTEHQAASFKASFSRRAALLLEGVEHWQKRQPATKGKRISRVTSQSQHVGLGVYIVQSSCSTRQTAVDRKR